MTNSSLRTVPYSIAIVLSTPLDVHATSYFAASDKIFSFSKRDICSVIFIFSLLFTRMYVLFLYYHTEQMFAITKLFLYHIYSIMQERDGILHLALKLSSQINYYFLYLFFTKVATAPKALANIDVHKPTLATSLVFGAASLCYILIIILEEKIFSF